MKLILLDMDGVLLHSAGYHQALHDTVLWLSRSLGLPAFDLSADDIAQFEALGITNEWHSSAICSALMSLNHGGRPQIPPTAHSSGSAERDAWPDLKRIFEVLDSQSRDLPPLSRAREAIRFLASSSGADAAEALHIIDQSESPGDSQTLDLFQEMILGSEIFEKTYGLKGRLGTGSYLEQYDRPLLDRETKELLKEWGSYPDHGLAILTNRPSRSLPDSPSTPEAQIGARQVGLQGVPIVGQGEMIWLARQVGRPDTSMLKPAPAHALAAIRAASGLELHTSLLEAFSSLNGQATDWRFADGGVVAVLEDTTAGLISAGQAQDQLRSAGVQIELQKIGISPEPVKQFALARQGATVYETINQALAHLL